MGIFHFKRFDVDDSGCAMKIGTDGVLLGAWARADGAEAIIDVGSGTGLVAMMMAQRYDCVPVAGVEVDASACMYAAANVASSPWAGRIVIVHADILSMDLSSCFSLAGPDGELRRPLCIVSNPPFFTEALRSPDGARALARHGDGLCVETLIAWAAKVMAGNGDRLSFIAPAGQDDDIQYSLTLHRLMPVRITDVITREGRSPMRCLYEVACDVEAGLSCVHDELVIRNADGSYSRQYVELTGQFYLNF